MPPAPSSLLLPVSPETVSLYADARTFSKPEILSAPTPVFCATVVLRSIMISVLAFSKLTVSVPPLPSKVSSPSFPSIVSSPAAPLRILFSLSPLSVSTPLVPKTFSIFRIVSPALVTLSFSPFNATVTAARLE